MAANLSMCYTEHSPPHEGEKERGMGEGNDPRAEGVNTMNDHDAPRADNEALLIEISAARWAVTDAEQLLANRRRGLNRLLAERDKRAAARKSTP